MIESQGIREIYFPKGENARRGEKKKKQQMSAALGKTLN